MNNIAGVLSTSLYRTKERKNFYSPIDTIVPPAVVAGAKITTAQADALMDDCSDLITDASYRPFFFKKLYALGPTAFMQLAEHARKYGRYPDRLFVNLLRKTGGSA